MSNTNCLRGLQCPECESYEPFHIEAVSVFKFYDNGTDELGDTDWGEKSLCVCCECCFTGTVKDFKEKKNVSDVAGA